MRPRLRALVLVPALALALAACTPALPPDPGVPPAYIEVLQIGAEAQSMYQAGRWGDAAKLYRKQADAAAGDANLGGWRDQALYNLACVLARDGQTAAAADALALSIAEGSRPALGPAQGGGWMVQSAAVTIPHLLADPDLDSIREEPAYRAALRGVLAAGEANVVATGGATGSEAAARRPVVVVLVHPGVRSAPDGSDPPPVVASAPDWVAAAGDRPLLVVALAPPIRPHPRSDVSQTVSREGVTIYGPPLRAWRLADGDDRWAIAKVRETLDALAADPRADMDRVYIAAPVGDPEAAVAAWASALAMPDRIAGIAVPGGAFRRAPWADALAAVPSKRAGKAPWSVVLSGSDVAAEMATREAGIESHRVVSIDGIEGILEVWIGR